jgi:hypothetical protein
VDLLKSMSKAGQLITLVFLEVLLGGGCATRALFDWSSDSESAFTEALAETEFAADFEDQVDSRSAGAPSRLPFERQLVERGYTRAEAREICSNLSAMDPEVRQFVTGMVLAMARDSRTPQTAADRSTGRRSAARDPQALSADDGLLGQDTPQPSADRATPDHRTTASTVATSSQESATPATRSQTDQGTSESPQIATNSTAEPRGAAVPTRAVAAASAANAPGKQRAAIPTQAQSADTVGTSSSTDKVVEHAAQPATADQEQQTKSGGISGNMQVANASPSEIVDEQVEVVAASEPLGVDAAEDSSGLLPSEVEDAELHWRKQLRQAVTKLTRELREHPPADSQELARQQMYLSLLHLVAEDRDKSMEALENVSDEELEFWRQTVMGLGVLLDPDEMPRFRQRVDLATDHLRKGVSTLSTLGPLRLNNLALCSKVNGFGDFEEFSTYKFRPGQLVILYVEVENFHVVQHDPLTQDSRRMARRRNLATESATFHTELHGRWEILDADQRPVASRELPVDRNRCRNRRHDYFIPYTLYLPEKMEPGYYTLELTIEDKQGDKFGNAAIDFQIQ